MTKFTKRSLAFAIAIVMCLSLFSVFALNVGASSTTASGTVNYKYSGKYIYNWGEREEVATFLSPNAIAFHEKYNTTYEKLAGYKGGTDKSNVPSSQMYKELASLMSNAHTHITSYEETKNLYKYTDCENNGSVISSFYSGVSIGPAWDGGSTWNREHTWPNSKGNGSSENDIMMLRPTSMRENSSRGNKAYGKTQSTSYYDPNEESNGNHDLRGDVARIFLYVYVRWGNDNRNNAWGASGVMESPEVMLEWMEADPVDTWEIGRNDSVQAITGTRNVFVDYPELAFLLFGEEIPKDYTTPSGKGENGTPVKPTECTHEYNNDCDTTCNLCGEIRVIVHTYSYGCDTTCNICGFVREANGHIYSFYCDETCNNCGFKRTVTHIYTGWQTIKEATETEAGLEKGSCYHCKVEVEREIPKLGTPTDKPTTPPDEDKPTEAPDCANGKHAFSAWAENKNGVNERYCNECGYVELETDKPETSEHIFTEWEVNKDGVKERYCTECGLVETDSQENEGGSSNSSSNSSSSNEEGGFFAKIGNFLKNIFEKIFSIFKKKK